MQNLHLLEFSTENLPPGPLNIDNGTHGTEKLLPNIQISENFP